MTDLKIKPAKLSDRIVEQLENLLLEGSFSPGQKLPSERELAERFDVSRPSLREAIQKLEAKGLVSRRQGGGTYIKDTLAVGLTDPLFELIGRHPESQFDLLEFRHALEGISAYYAALRGTEADHIKIKTLYEDICRTQQQQDIDAQAMAVGQFYLAVAEASHNVVLLHLVRGLTPLVEQNVRLNLAALQHSEGIAEKLNEHRQRLMQAVINGEPELARQASNGHLAFIEEALLEVGKERSRIERSLRRSQQA
ncbi:pyruvate dehydrogenase complex transcriptional repressor PdhR [Alishewanella sp. 16-MA]|uniref:Pyruvate dehydrogenase complex repressor n=1 Tax=Alishewanella maricola TaxID=2795740 RepID=A0ABS8C6Y9_9ALTE|nr:MULTISPECIES: pyruvate dehydrogenase complex transcriptional repressor PdhR [Alishewanella]MDP4946419.1 pyruvate dehydrogenase complex transcriptional repressor PdhR [Alishewanella sp.]MCB5227895.1 pyruvate dehydrogenase complex transcriptional repressor PdhR [Alishewanella maricola]MDP5036008.1 pyruvate dehydrogenase complex transcriptional repressor PdhR [Alishewanella sp.]MDP5185880.1 pyruvate dehydrogenase complex transcriptional repressor PdhR [Alishewanella sp.]MDP5459753.1 pyruvate d